MSASINFKENIYNVLLEYQRTRDVNLLHANLGLFNRDSHAYHEVAGFLCGDCRDLVRMDTLTEKLRKEVYCKDADCDGAVHTLHNFTDTSGLLVGVPSHDWVRLNVSSQDFGTDINWASTRG